MKPFKITIGVALIIMQISIQAQNCLPGENYLSTQSDIDNFQLNYPGCTKVEGMLFISGDNITNLNGLSVLTSIYHLELYDIDLTNLNGLNNVNDITYIAIGRCNSLESLTGLENVTTLDRGLNIYYNSNLKNLEGLSKLNSVGDLFNIRYTSLKDLTGLNSLSSVDYLSIYENDSLINLNGLENLNHIASNLEVSNNSIADITGLRNVNYAHVITFSNNNNLASLEGLDNIDPESITYLALSNNSSLTTCEVQSVCDYLAGSNISTYIANNASGCNSQQEIEDACEFAPQPCLPEGIIFSTQTEIDEFKSNHPNCIEIEGDVLIEGNDITNLAGLDSIFKIQGNLEIANNPLLKNLNGITRLGFVGKNFEVWGNDSITSLNGLTELISIDNSIKISGNPLLVNLNGIESLTSIGENIEIAYNENLIDLNGLINLNAIWGDLMIFGNSNLSDINGIANINAATIKGLYIYENNELSKCDIESICDYLTSPNGIIDIRDNSEDCNSKEEVVGLCTEGLNPQLAEYLYLVYPNPAKQEIHISNKQNIKVDEITIINNMGQLVLTQKNNTELLDISELNKGLFILELQIENQKYRTRIVIN